MSAAAAADPEAQDLRVGVERRWHLTVLVLCALIIGASVLLDGDTREVEVLGYTLPGLCMFKALTGMNCPGCGLTRSFVFMGEGSILEAFRMHLLGPVIWVFFAAQIPLRAMRLWRLRAGGNAPEGGVS
ncbi:MAG: DUF2752 domain-containing protein [Alphaproteobacteria bacterium]|nr:DUF2752 domain-containing protein [Alphaproteobacteria bacterium]MCB9794407.1 DUF2752 domain-containing protein [Alphaproteobacteria bacterium]